MPLVVLDTGFIISLAVDRRYADAVRALWETNELWVPASVPAELRLRRRYPGEIPPELPGRALGIISSSRWAIKEVAPTDAEGLEIRTLQDRVGGPGTPHHAGECEATVLIATRDSDALLALDDASSLPVLTRYLYERTGKMLRYVHTSTVIAELVTSGAFEAKLQKEVLAQLTAKRRPLI